MQTISTENTPFVLDEDKPLSPQGRFNRLSYLGWNFLYSIIVTAIVMVFMLLAGGSAVVFLGSINPDGYSETASFASVGIFSIGVFFIALVSLYFAFVFAIRRLHDIDLTVLVFAPGTKGINRFGPVRPSKGWEIVLGWLYVVFFIFGILFYGAFVGMLMSTIDPANIASPPSLEAPTKIL
ncbi:hypothetical protein GWI33_010013 [Rhynchophorus ferrugineus]|uniref:Uncharacterized protein n=1 Tax=Rhynchophorus ferrugineus TaxID=354439 RepID=A0A834MFN7_RHYFE|nr:hypothetical protein GWI33_010013 [Rhynchophorus ferrugineus]